MKRAFELLLVNLKTNEMEVDAEHTVADSKSKVSNRSFGDGGDTQDSKENVDTLLALLPKRASCFVHTMQLCIVHALEKVKEMQTRESGDHQSQSLVIHSAITK